MKGNTEDIAVRISTVSIAGNLILSLLKLLAGIFSNSGAMISDAVHSASDVFSSIIVIIGVKMSAKKSDKEHPYGHERMECVAAIILAVVLLVTGLFIGNTTIQSLKASNFNEFQIPGITALIAAVVSIIVKEAMFWYTRHYAKILDSGAVMADAWHHRSDALSSVGALIGIAGARMGVPVLEPAASLIICAFILKASYDIFRDAVDKMVDHSCDEETESQLVECAMAQDGVHNVDLIQTRIFGNKIYVDIEISMDGSQSLSYCHSVAEKVHSEIESHFPKVKHIMVHINPDGEEEENWKD